MALTSSQRFAGVWRKHDERGAAAVEYAVVTVAAGSLGAVLLAAIVPVGGPGLPMGRFLSWILQFFDWLHGWF